MQKIALEAPVQTPSATWRSASQPLVDKVVFWLAATTVGTSFAFMVFPMIDQTVARWFVKGGTFFLSDHPFLKAVRDLSRQSLYCIIIAMVVLICLHFVLPRRRWFCRPHKPLFVLLSFMVGPVAIVEALKALIGRARPRDLLEFGGHADFTPVWQFAAACTRNCSFPSGEAAGAAAALSLVVLVASPYRAVVAAITAPCLVFIAFNRVLFGAHFLSDVMLGWLLTLLAMALIWRCVEGRSAAIDDFFARDRPSHPSAGAGQP
ncbi:phosphatase PAP2 family protein [Rhizobium wuzhouense]|nr:phosphatase PAP2 family protein [Rhizobium wuzhouense]